MKLIFLCFAGLFGISAAVVVRYDNFALYRVFPSNENHLTILNDLRKSGAYDFWTDPTQIGRSVDILVSPRKKNYFEKLVTDNHFHYSIVMNDLQQRIDEENQLNFGHNKIEDGDLTWDKYYSLDKINNWLRKLAKENPDIVTLVEAGRSYENRTILGVKISFGPGNEKRTVWIDSQIHAREWISGATSTYILNAVLSSEDPSIRAVAATHDWYFFPVINPDGYEYTFTTDRMWRKTRTPYGNGCKGADPNRNWDYKWNEESDNYPCSDIYAGPAPFSEIECKTLSEFMTTVADELLLFITFHSYSQFILLPYGHTTEHLDNYNVTYPIGLKAANALSKRYGTKYIVGNIAETIYTATGSNMDWLKGIYHVPFAYAYELRDTGNYGFVLPPEQIIPTALETLDSIVTILNEIDKL